MAAFITPIVALIDRILPDKAANDAAKAQLLQMQVSGELQSQMGQIDINKIEAGAASKATSAIVQFFIAGWRPAIGWLCGLGLLWQYFLAPLLGFFAQNHRVPAIDSTSLADLLMALLGMGALRTVDKVTGKGSGH